MPKFVQLDEHGREDIESRILRYLGGWTEGLSTVRMESWIRSCTKNGGYDYSEYQAALYRLRNSGLIAIANKVWYIRKQTP